MLSLYIDNSPVKIKYLRLNEAGDFPDQRSVNRWSMLSDWLNDKYGIKVYCYTCRLDLDFSKATFAVNGSNEEINNAKRFFICVDKDEYESLPEHSVTCKGNCRLCKLCYDSKYKGVIYCKQH
jgi:hypothetical protein